MKQMTILIAEDDDCHYQLAVRYLRRGGISNKIVRFNNGQDVLDYLDKQLSRDTDEVLPYILLLDIKMPRVSGIEILQRIRSDEKPVIKDMSVIILTSSDNPHDVKYCYNLGCNAYVLKSFEREELVDTVNWFLSRSAQEANCNSRQAV